MLRKVNLKAAAHAAEKLYVLEGTLTKENSGDLYET